jgi:ribonuclease BN (tRNA processing enzyme)
MLIFDAGTGLVALGEHHLAEGTHPKSIHLLSSHYHWDHIQGLPFYKPLYSPNYQIKLYGPPGLAWAMACQMSRPHFPVAFTQLPSNIDMIELAHMEPITLEGLKVTPFEVNHPQQTFGYRVDDGAQSVVYATDHEPDHGKFDAHVIAAARGADLLVIDAQYTEREITEKRGWGHGTFAAGVRIAKAAGVRKLALYHHDPFHSDREIAEIEKEAKKLFPELIIATEGESETIGGDEVAAFRARKSETQG